VLRWQADPPARQEARATAPPAAADPALRSQGERDPPKPAAPRGQDPGAKPPVRDEPPPAADARRSRALLERPEVLWSGSFGPGLFRAAVALPSGIVAVAGSAPGDGDQKDYNDATLSWIDARGGSLNRRVFRREDNNEVRQLLALGEDGFVLAGRAKRKGSLNFKAWIVGVTPAGMVAWQKFFPEGNEDRIDQAYDLARLDDGRLLFVGQSGKRDAHGDGWTVMLDRAGAVAWEHLHGEAKRVEDLRRLVALPDGTFIAAGSIIEAQVQSRVWLLRFDGAGRVLGETFPDTSGRSRASDLQRAGDGAVLAGWSETADGAGPSRRLSWLRKLDRAGKEQWKVDLPTVDGERIWRVLTLDDGGFVVLLSRFLRERGPPRLVRLDSAGNRLWELSIEGAGALRDLVLLPQGGLVAFGAQIDSGRNQRAWAVGLGYRQ
jgi:hypothetical protein